MSVLGGSRVRLALRVVGVVCAAVLLAFLWPQVFGGRVSYVMVSGTSMEPAMHTGDLVLVRTYARYAVGDAVAFRVPRGETGAGQVVIHRLIERRRDGRFRTQGDNRTFVDPWTPEKADIVGKRWLLVPRAGIVVAYLRTPIVLGAVSGLLTMWVLMPSRSRGSRGDRDLAAQTGRFGFRGQDARTEPAG